MFFSSYFVLLVLISRCSTNFVYVLFTEEQKKIKQVFSEKRLFVNEQKLHLSGLIYILYMSLNKSIIYFQFSLWND